VRRSPIKPPPVLAGCRVTEYAVRDRSAKYSGRSNLFVEGKELGPVPRLAIVRDHQGKYLLLHCGRSWNVLGIAGGRNLRRARLAAERTYPGISKRWVRTGVSKSQAEAYLKQVWKGQECSFCGRRPDQVEQMVEGQGSRICDFCIRARRAAGSRALRRS
jgi:hypothetical protein